MFKQLIGQRMVRFQNSILEHLHHYTIFNTFFDGRFEAHHAWILSCFGSGVDILAYNSTSLFNFSIIFPNLF